MVDGGSAAESVTGTPRGGEMSRYVWTRWLVTVCVTGMSYAAWDVSRSAHDPAVAGSNPAPAINMSAVSPQVNGPQA